MNKLDVALKLLQLLNERKTIDSKIVAQELGVSLRTAQRYLVELSILPCVAGKQNDHTYSLNPDYALNGALKTRTPDKQSIQPLVAHQKMNLRKTICLMCGEIRGSNRTIPLASGKEISNVARIDKLAAIISRRLKGRRCSFP
ncbi:MAG TPA: hypothetical protein VJ550_11340 [Geomonas sp.]|nr:hypothetical protein [Geomonas sp.]